MNDLTSSRETSLVVYLLCLLLLIFSLEDPDGILYQKLSEISEYTACEVTPLSNDTHSSLYTRRSWFTEASHYHVGNKIHVYGRIVRKLYRCS